jgi:hypothetical protein
MSNREQRLNKNKKKKKEDWKEREVGVGSDHTTKQFINLPTHVPQSLTFAFRVGGGAGERERERGFISHYFSPIWTVHSGFSK